jgi:hypothetical protein
MNRLDNPAVFTIFTADLIALALWIPRSPAGFNFNGDGTAKPVAGPRAAISGLRLSDGLPALQDRLNQIRAQKGEANQASDVAPSDAVTLGRVLQRSDTARGELVKPRAPARDHLDQRRIASRGVVLLRQPRQHQAWSRRRAA